MRSVLVVDDDRAMTKTICAILRVRGWHTVQAFTGEEAVAAAARQPFSAVLMDVMMPHMNGVEAYHRIRQCQPATPVILMTAYATHELLQQATRDGVVCVFSKPIDWPRLTELLESVGATREGVLLIDPDPAFATMLADALRAEGHPVHQVSALPDALDALTQRQARIVVLDLNLPGVNPEAALLAIRELRPTVSVVLCSAQGPLLARARSAAPGWVHATLQKPFAPDRLLELLDDLPQQ